jgi:hypothetical protein
VTEPVRQLAPNRVGGRAPIPFGMAVAALLGMGGAASACMGPAQEEGAPEQAADHAASAPGAAGAAESPGADDAPPATLRDSVGAPGGAGIGAAGAGAGADRAPVARLNVILAPETWVGIDDLSVREVALLRTIEALLAGMEEAVLPRVSIEVSPAIGAVRLTLPDSIFALALASKLMGTGAVTSADLDRQEVRRHP